MKLSEVTRCLEGKLVSDGEFKRLDYCTVNEGSPFLSFFGDPKFLPQLSQNEHISCVLCTPELSGLIPASVQGIFITKHPKACFEQIHNNLKVNSEYLLPEVGNTVGANCSISDQAYIFSKNVTIGNNVIIEAFAWIGEHVTICDNCYIHSGAVIGGQSFSCARSGLDDVIKMNDYGSLFLDQGVEIRSLSHIARGILPSDCTYIGRNSQIDTMVHIGHGVKTGSRVFISSGSIIGGNSQIGKDVWIGLNATVSNRIRIGDNARVSLGAVVIRDVEPGETVSGNFAIEHFQMLRHQADMLKNKKQR